MRLSGIARTVTLMFVVVLAGCSTQQPRSLGDCCAANSGVLFVPATVDTATSRLEPQPLGSGYLDRRRQVSDRATAEHKMRQVRRLRDENRVAADDTRRELVKAFESRFGAIERD